MSGTDWHSRHERQRIRRWRGSLADTLTEEDRRLVEYLHGGSDGLECLRRLLARLGAGAVMLARLTEYYHTLTLRKATQSGGAGGDP